MSVDTGVLGSGTITTGATGQPATVTFYDGTNKINVAKFNRTATITASVAAANNGTSVSAQIPVNIVGSTVAMSSTATTLPSDSTSPATVTITVKDGGGNILPNAAVALNQTAGSGAVKITQINNPVLANPSFTVGVTDSNGQYVATVAGSGAGTVTITAAALGTQATTKFTVATVAASFGIDKQTLNGTVVAGNPNPTAMKVGACIPLPSCIPVGSDSLALEVNAPSSANVTFATTTGVWNGGTTSAVTVAVVAGKATATLTSAQTGLANIQVYDAATPTTSATLTAAMTSGLAANSITLQPTPSVVSPSIGTTAGISKLIATVRDVNNQPVGGVPVAFTIVNPTGGGETVSPAVVFSNATAASGIAAGLGQASSTFTSGSLSTGSTGVQIRASVVCTPTTCTTPAVATNTSPSGNDATIVIGGTAGSVAFGMATSVGFDSSNSNYTRDMSVLVADSNGNPVPSAVVSLSLWPIAWSTGTVCAFDDTVGATVYGLGNGAKTGTFYNTDINENLILDTGESGTRTYYPTGIDGVGTLPTNATGVSTLNGLIPPNSAAGTLVSKLTTDAPGTVTTNAQGVGAFTWTYTKNSAIWTVGRIRATVVVQGTATVNQIVHRLDAVSGDVGAGVACLLPDSPYKF